jgi:hypothetical protein
MPGRPYIYVDQLIAFLVAVCRRKAFAFFMLLEESSRKKHAIVGVRRG